jgi:hypothetical protein
MYGIQSELQGIRKDFRCFKNIGSPSQSRFKHNLLPQENYPAQIHLSDFKIEMICGRSCSRNCCTNGLEIERGAIGLLGTGLPGHVPSTCMTGSIVQRNGSLGMDDGPLTIDDGRSSIASRRLSFPPFPSPCFRQAVKIFNREERSARRFFLRGLRALRCFAVNFQEYIRHQCDFNDTLPAGRGGHTWADTQVRPYGQ